MKYIKLFEEVRKETPIYKIGDIVTCKRYAPKRKIIDVEHEVGSGGRLNVLYTYVEQDIDNQQSKIIDDMEKSYGDDSAFSIFKSMMNKDKEEGWGTYPHKTTQFSMVRWRDKPIS
jgi:hypothetical protein